MMISSQEGRENRLVFVPSPFHGHLTPMLQLAKALESKGFSITIAHTKFNFPDHPSKHHSNFTFIPFSDGLSSCHISSKNVVDIASTLNLNCISPLKDLLMNHMIDGKGRKISCIIYDGMMYFTEAVAEELNIPSMVMRTTNATTVLTYHALPRLQKEGYFPLQDGRSEELVPQLHPLRFKDLPNFNLPSSDVMLDQITKSIYLSSSLGVIWNTVERLEASSLAQLQQVYYQIPFFPIGPLHLISQDTYCSSSLHEEDFSCMTWLNKQEAKSVMYVSLGSIASWNEKELTEMAWGLANSGQPFLLVIRGMASDHAGCSSDWTKSLPDDLKEAMRETGSVVRWAPQKQVLAHPAVGGFWSHGGWNSTLESLCEGVPMICQPFFGDQRVNSRMLSHVWKVGMEWRGALERIEIESTVRKLMVESEGEEMRLRALKLKEEIKECTREDGTSNKAMDELVHYILSI